MEKSVAIPSNTTTIMRAPSFNLCEAGEETKSTRNRRWYLGIASAKVMSLIDMCKKKLLDYSCPTKIQQSN